MGITNYIPSLEGRRALKDSGVLTSFNTVIIPAGTKLALALDQRFQFYDDVMIVNLNNDNDCSITINSGIEQPLPKGNELQVSHPAVKRIVVTNNGSTNINIGEIQAYYRHTGTVESQKLSNYASIGTFVMGFFKR